LSLTHFSFGAPLTLGYAHRSWDIVLLGGSAIATVWALMAGVIILNLLQEDLPTEQESHVGRCVTGATGYAMVLLAM